MTKDVHCWGPCGEKLGKCDNFCGAGRYCCNPNDERCSPQMRALVTVDDSRCIGIAGKGLVSFNAALAEWSFLYKIGKII